MNAPLQTKQRRGCLFYAVLVGVILLLLLLAGLGVGYLTVRSAINHWTDTKPSALPQTQISQAEAAQVQQRISSFKERLNAGASASPLELSPREINGLISTSPEYAEVKDKVSVDIVDGQLRGQVSVPLDKTGLGKGRFLNGTGMIKARLENGSLVVNLDSFQVNGKPLPEMVMSRLRSVNFAEGLKKDSQATAILSKLARIEVKDGKIVIVPQSAPN